MHVKKIVLVSTILLIFLFLKVLNTHHNVSTPSVKGNTTESLIYTEVIEYRQTYIPEEKITGECWTSSIAAASNHNAFRCNSAQQMFDPCFSDNNGRVVCDVDPEKQGSGFELVLTKSLPSTENILSSDKALPWLIKLKDERYCSVYTGTAIRGADGKFYYMYCYDNTHQPRGDGDLDKSGNPWKVNIIHSTNDQDDSSIETVDVVKAWK